MTKSTTGTSRGLPLLRPQVADAFERGGQRDHGAGRQGHHDVAADGRGVPDLERHQEGVDALVEQRHGAPFRRPLEVVQLDDLAGRGDLEARRRLGERRPAQPLEVDQRVGGDLRLGEQPGSAAQEGVAVAPFDLLERLRPLHVDDRIEVHAIPLCSFVVIRRGGPKAPAALRLIDSAYFRSSSEVGPGPGVIRVGHCLEPNGTAGGRVGCLPRRCISEMMVLRPSPPISSKSMIL